MPEVEARRSPRIDYRAPVELLASHEEQALLAHAVDLGAGGIRVTAPVSMPIGAPVTCRFAIDGRPTAVLGHVAWSRSHEVEQDGHRLGICFDALSGYIRGLLEHAVARGGAGYRSVELHFEALEEPVIARARARSHGIRLSAALPILARGSVLTFRLDEEGPLYRGQVADAVISEDGRERRLEVDVDVEEHDSVRFRRRARYGYVGDLDAQPLPVRAAQTASAVDGATTPWWRSTLWTLFGAAVGVGLSFALTSSAPWQAPPLPWIATPAPVQTPLRQTAAPQPAPARAAEPRASSAVLAQAAPAPPVLAPTPAITPIAPAAPPPAPDVVASPVARVDGLVTRVRIPFDGTLEGMAARVWAQPLALAVDLPQGGTTLAPRGYPINQGGVSELRVSTRGTELLLRLKLEEAPEHYTLTAQDGALEVLMVRSPAPESAPSSPDGE